MDVVPGIETFKQDSTVNILIRNQCFSAKIHFFQFGIKTNLRTKLIFTKVMIVLFVTDSGLNIQCVY